MTLAKTISIPRKPKALSVYGVYRLTFLFFLVFLTWAPCRGQDASHVSNGIYLTKNDFNKDILSYPSLSQGDALIEIYGGDIELKRDKKTITFLFGEFYGYKVRGYKFFNFGKRGAFRFFGYYQIVDQSGLIIYNQRIPSSKYLYVDEPYFSLYKDSAKYALNVRNLRKCLLLDPPTVREIRWLKRHVPSLAQVVNRRSVINELLFGNH